MQEPELARWPYGAGDRAIPTLKGLTAAQEAELTVAERIEACWPYIVQICLKYETRLRLARVPISAQDLAQATVLALVKKAPKWDPARGKWITFVKVVFRNVQAEEREKVGAVTAPRKAWSRLKAYRRDAAAGTITPAKSQTMECMAAVMQRQPSLRTRL